MAVDWRSLSAAQMLDEIKAGGRFVQYSYCISILIMSFKRHSNPRFIRAGQSALLAGLPWTAITFLLGWWGIPWGPIWSIQCIARNMQGGHDITAAVVHNTC
jgi:hypothetical protein